jgi:hypothetical protein
LIYTDLQQECRIKIRGIFRQCAYEVTLRRFRVTIVAVEKHEVAYIVRVCILALANRHAQRMRRICYLWPV